jgi:tRNA pseudouridine55 synthase
LQSVLTTLLPTLEITSSDAGSLKKGQIIPIMGPKQAGWTALVTMSGEFIGVGEILGDGRVAPRRLLQQKDAACV